MTLYLLFLVLAAATVASPGPGVVMTLTNAIRFGYRSALGGVLGLAVGAMVLALLSVTGLGVVLATSMLLFTLLKFAGAAYLIFLGVRLWLRPAPQLDVAKAHAANFPRRFVEGLSLQLSNPKAIFFYLSVFPQFIDLHRNYERQFFILSLSYCALLFLIHSLYAVFAGRMKAWLISERGGRLLNRAGGAAFVFFGAALAVSKR